MGQVQVEPNVLSLTKPIATPTYISSYIPLEYPFKVQTLGRDLI